MRRALAIWTLLAAFLLSFAGSASAYVDYGSKNRVGSFGDPFASQVGLTDPLALELHQENTIAIYDPATGVLVYVRQNPWTFFDPLGLQQGRPKNWGKHRMEKLKAQGRYKTPGQAWNDIGTSIWSGLGRGVAQLGKVPVYVNPGLWIDRGLDKLTGNTGPSVQEQMAADIDAYSDEISKSTSGITGGTIDKQLETITEIATPVPPLAKGINLFTTSAKVTNTTTKLTVAAETKIILNSPEMKILMEARAAGKSTTVQINGRTIGYSPDLPASAMTWAEKKGWHFGDDAFSSSDELTKTVTQELHRLENSKVLKEGADATSVARETEEAFEAAEEAVK